MTKYKKQAVSEKSQLEAETITKGTQKPGQTKEQSKLIAQGIAKGIELYKKQQKAKLREKNKQAKKELKEKASETEAITEVSTAKHSILSLLPWGLLVASWIGFALFYSQNV